MRLISQLLWSIFIVSRSSSAQKLLLLFLDGFRWDYINNTHLRGFEDIKKHGAYIRKVVPVFPADCHPNIYSIFTGLYPRHHGVLGNRVYSSSRQAHFDHDDAVHRRSVHEWVQAEPLWVTSRRQGRRSFIYHLPICESSSAPLSPSHCVPYSRDDMNLRAFNNSVREALRSLDRDMAHFAIVYNDQLDRLTHSYGPQSSRLWEQLLPSLDALLQATLEAVRANGRAGRADTHLVVLSDHGMAQIAKERQIFLERLVLRSQIDHVLNQGGYASIWPLPGHLREVHQRLVMGALASRRDGNGVPAFRVYTSSTIPPHWNVLHSDMSAPLLMVAAPGYFIVSRERDFPDGSDFYDSGWHGYAPEHDEMASPMLAFGPDIPAGTHVDTAHVTDIYQLLVRLLDISPRSHNGSSSFLPELLTGGAWSGDALNLELVDDRTSDSSRSSTSSTIIIIIVTAVVMMVMMMVTRL